MTEKYKIKIFYKIDEEIENIWLSLENRNRKNITIFQTLNWQKKWIENIGDKTGVLSIIFVEKLSDNSKLLIPMIINSKNFINVLQFTGYPFSDFNLSIGDNTFDYKDIEIIFELILRKNIINRRIDVIKLINQPENIFGIKNPIYNINFLKIRENISYKIQTNLILEKNILMKKENKFIKQDYNRIEKKIKNLNFRICASYNEKKRIIDFISKKKSEQYKRSNTLDLFSNKYYKDFFECFIENNNINLSYIYTDKKILAAHYGFMYENIFYYIFPVYDFSEKHLSPGNLLLYRLINNYLDKVNFFDFTVGGEKYKKKWSNYNVKMSDNLKILNARGFLYLIYIKLLKILSSNQKIKNFLKYIYIKFK